MIVVEFNMENINKFGVYMILNILNDKKYIGSTTVSFKKRWWSHKASLRHNKHKNVYLQNSWNKYGEDNFKFIILDIIDDKNLVLQQEQQWIEKYNFSRLYNINENATGGNQFSEETIKKRTETITKYWRKLSAKYKLWKVGKLLDEDCTNKELIQFNKWINHVPLNKGKKMKCTKHLQVPKKKKGDRSNFKINTRRKLPEIEVYDKNMNLLRIFNSSKDLEEWSLTDNNNLPVNSRFSCDRMGKPRQALYSVNINKSCKTNKPYKGLYFKYKQSPL